VLALLLAAFLYPTSPAPQDAYPVWSPDARYVGFRRDAEPGARGGGAYVVAPGHGPLVPRGPGAVVGWRPDEHELATVAGGRTRLASFPVDELAVVFPGVAFGYSRDGVLGYVRDGQIVVHPPDGTPDRAVAPIRTGESWDRGPVWSPDGTKIAFTTVDAGDLTSSLEVVNADGSGLHTVFSGPNQNVNPSWSPDGRTIAFESNATFRFRIWLVGEEGANLRPLLPPDPAADDRLPQWSPSGTRIAFISDREHRLGGATPYEYALYTVFPDGTTLRKLADDVHPYSHVRWSPTGAQLAFAAGRECERWGIYVMRPERGSLERRRTNDCHIVGTPRADTLHGTRYLDLIRGLGGDDRITGGDGHDEIDGGRGDDWISGGPYGDVLVGGPGRDRIDGGLGPDLIRVRDGERDIVRCGNGPDRVLADAHDVVARDCEEVAR
jgi:dipeptidyl aminopeptidase/acylaminoacyl peptidase